MKSFALNQFNKPGINSGFNDIYLDATGNIAIVSDIDEIIQNVNTAIWMIYGEYSFDTTIGIPYNRLLGAEPVDKTLIAYHLKKTILDINTYIPTTQVNKLGIKENLIVDFDMDLKNRILNISINMQLNSGTIISYDIDTANKQVNNLIIKAA